MNAFFEMAHRTILQAFAQLGLPQAARSSLFECLSSTIYIISLLLLK